jgi:hypothetical protein
MNVLCTTPLGQRVTLEVQLCPICDLASYWTQDLPACRLREFVCLNQHHHFEVYRPAPIARTA